MENNLGNNIVIKIVIKWNILMNNGFEKLNFLFVIPLFARITGDYGGDERDLQYSNFVSIL